MDEVVVKFVAVLAAGVALIVIACLAAGAYSNYLFVKGGYIECSVTGLQGGRWCK